MPPLSSGTVGKIRRKATQKRLCSRFLPILRISCKIEAESRENSRRKNCGGRFFVYCVSEQVFDLPEYPRGAALAELGLDAGN